MKTVYYSFLAILFILLGIFFSSCEKHNGNFYFRSLCKAELNGKPLIDQTRIEHAFSPDSPAATPCIEQTGDNYYIFRTELSENRDARPDYYINIYLPVKDVQEIVGKNFSFKKEIPDKFNPTDPGYSHAYYKWLTENSRCFATVFTPGNWATEYVESGSFKIESFDSNGSFYHGSFSLTFREGTVNGHFKVAAN